jgi:putative hydrolases of HD superfamily
MITNNLVQQFAFITEIDKIKSIFRKSRTFTGEKYENDAEHSWHICVMAMVLAEYANEKIDILKVIKMLLVHDIVEIDAGDTFLYAENRDDVFETEKAAAERIFGLLPDSQFREFMDLWLEFEAKETAEAKYAGSIDRLQPMLANCINQGDAWTENGVKAEQVYIKNQVIENGSKALWGYAKAELDKAMENGYLS